MTHPHWQTYSEDFEQPTQLVLEIDAFLQDRFAAGQQRPRLVTLDTLGVHPRIPARAQDLRQTAGIVVVGLLRIAASAAATWRASRRITS